MKMNIMEICEEVISEYALCDSCLGRQFASLDRTFGNKEKGRALKMVLHMQAQTHASTKRKQTFRLLKALAESGYEPSLITLRKMRRKLEIVTRPCYICSGFMERLEQFSVKAISSLGDVECSTVMIGCKMPLQVEEREDELKARFKLRHGENIRYEVTREIGKHIQALADKRVDKLRPDVTLIVRLPEGELEVNINPAFFKGRYRKLVGGIAQTRAPWLKGESIEEIVGIPLLDATRGEDMKFHGAGREDADARMTGNGRPFVIEIVKPKRRTVDLARIEEGIREGQKGRLEVLGLSKADKRDVVGVKIFGEKARKTYRAIIKLDREINESDLAQLERGLSDAIIAQRTPTRVLRRRGDRIRQKRLYSVSFKIIYPDTIEGIFRCDGGLYIKELISGDEGRTKPSLSDLADRKAECIELEVLDIGEI